MDVGCHTCMTLFLPDAVGSQGKRPNTHQSQPLSNTLSAPPTASNIHLVAPDAGENAYIRRNGVAEPIDLHCQYGWMKKQTTSQNQERFLRACDKKKSLTLHLLLQVVIDIRLLVKETEFGVFPKVAVEQVPEYSLRPQVLITSKPNRGARESHKQNGSKYTLAVLKVWQRIPKQNNVHHFSQEHTILPL